MTKPLLSVCLSSVQAILPGAAALLLMTSLPAGAHVVSQLYSAFREVGQTWELEILFDAGYADPAMRRDPDAAQPTRAWLAGLPPAEQARLTGEASRYLGEILALRSNGRPVSSEISFPDFASDPPDLPKLLNGGAYFHVLMRPGHEPAGDLELHLAGGDHPDLVVKMTEGGGARYFTVKPGTAASVISAGTAAEGRHPVPAALVQGFLHVVPAGLDHILFVLGIFLLRRHWKPLLWQSLAFTAAHTITLGLAAAGKLRVPGEIVEPVIALSITALAVENLFVREAKPWRLWLVFAFGLVHGLGFASVLSGWIGKDGWFLPTLIAANLGVELGQVAVLAAAWALTWRWHERPAWEHARRWACVALAATGLWWFAGRTGLLSVVPG
jgi:hypothetical protein